MWVVETHHMCRLTPRHLASNIGWIGHNYTSLAPSDFRLSPKLLQDTDNAPYIQDHQSMGPTPTERWIWAYVVTNGYKHNLDLLIILHHFLYPTRSGSRAKSVHWRPVFLTCPLGWRPSVMCHKWDKGLHKDNSYFETICLLGWRSHVCIHARIRWVKLFI